MSAVTTTTPEATPASSASSITSDINTAAAVASGIAEVTPVAPIAVPAIDGAAMIADLIVKMSAMYSQKVITAAQLNAMVKISVSGYDAALAAWNAAP